MRDKSEWEVTSNIINGQKMYAAYKIIDVSKVDYSGNREISGKYTSNKNEAIKTAQKLNEAKKLKESEELKNYNELRALTREYIRLLQNFYHEDRLDEKDYLAIVENFKLLAL